MKIVVCKARRKRAKRMRKEIIRNKRAEQKMRKLKVQWEKRQAAGVLGMLTL